MKVTGELLEHDHNDGKFLHELSLKAQKAYNEMEKDENIMNSLKQAMLSLKNERETASLS